MSAKVALVGLVLLLAVFPGFTNLPERIFALAEDPPPFGGGYLDELLVTAVLEHADNELAGDPFNEVDGLFVKRSNYSGIVLGDRTYYYCLAPHFCSCPVCRGERDLSEVEIVYVDAYSDFPILVYCLDELITPSTLGAGMLIVP